MTWQELIDKKDLRDQAFLWEENGNHTIFILKEIREDDCFIYIVGRKINCPVIGTLGTMATSNTEIIVAKGISQPRVEDDKIIVCVPNVGLATFSTKTI